MTKSLCLFALLLLLPQSRVSSPRIVKLDETKYNIFTKEYEASLVLIYEEWCGFSKKALKIFNQLMRNTQFTRLDVQLGLFDVHQFPDFKAYNRITQFPLIELHLHKVKVTYTGLLNETYLVQWVSEKMQQAAITALESLDSFNEVKAKNESFVYFSGE